MGFIILGEDVKDIDEFIKEYLVNEKKKKRELKEKLNKWKKKKK